MCIVMTESKMKNNVPPPPPHSSSSSSSHQFKVPSFNVNSPEIQRLIQMKSAHKHLVTEVCYLPVCTGLNAVAYQCVLGLYSKPASVYGSLFFIKGGEIEAGRIF